MKTASIRPDFRMTRAGELATRLSVLLLAATLAACGGGDDASKAAAARAKAAAAKKAEPSEEELGRAPSNPDMANAIATTKTSAAIDLQYLIAEKPKPGAPFSVVLSFAPRLAADNLEIEISGMPGLTVVDPGTPSFQQVQARTRHDSTVRAQAEAPGLYYINVIAKMVSKLQTDVRTFSVPVVVGEVTAAEKSAVTATTDAAGEQVESAKALETTDAQKTP